MLNLNSIMIGTMQPDVLGEFYAKVLDKAADMQEEKWYGWQVGNSFLSIGEHSEMAGSAKDPGRIMFNLETEGVDAEFERIKGIGATIIKEPYDPDGESGMRVATFADPDGNYFQLMKPWKRD